jgi:cytosine/adenosine deaminase-related metal-dependent hydrolase
MKKIVTISLLLVFVKISFSQCFIDSNIVAIKNISVIPMTDTSTVLSHKTVLIQNNTITQIDDTSNVNIPSNAFVINGTGKYLIPGLCDMHAHLLQRNDAILELANGVTTVCNMHGEPWHISWFNASSSINSCDF